MCDSKLLTILFVKITNTILNKFDNYEKMRSYVGGSYACGAMLM